MKTSYVFGLLFSLGSFVSTGSAQSSTFLEDTVFSNWTFASFGSSGSNSTVFRHSFGGNRGPHLEIQHVADTVVNTALLNQEWQWRIGVQSSIQTLGIHYDIHSRMSQDQGMFILPLIFQDSKYFVPKLETYTTGSHIGWDNQRTRHIAIENYVRVDPVTLSTQAHDFDGTEILDLSRGGPTMTFGFLVGNMGTGPSYELKKLFDNVSVLINGPFELMLVGDPIAGGNWLMHAFAEPMERVYFLASVDERGQGPCIPSLGGLCLDITAPIYNLGAYSTNSIGIASASVSIPATLPYGTILSAQAVIRRGLGGIDSVKSNAATDAVE